MSKKEFTYAIGRVRVWETKLLDRQKMDRLIESKSAQDFWRLLSETDYAEGINAANHREEETVFQKRRISVRNFIVETAAHEPVLMVFLWKDDLHNLKVLIKERLTGSDLRHLMVNTGFYPADMLREAWESERISGDFEPWLINAISFAKNALQENIDLFRIEPVLDRYYFDQAAEIMGKSIYEVTNEIWQKMIDAVNFKNMIRAGKMGLTARQWEVYYLPGGYYNTGELMKLYNADRDVLLHWLSHSNIAGLLAIGGEEITDSPVRVETAVDNYIFSLWREKKADPFGPAALISFFLAVEQEVKMLRLILAAKRNGLAPEHIRERMRHVV